MAATATISRPVQPASGAAHADLPRQDAGVEPGYVVEAAKARAQAAQRAYMMAQVAAGVNPLNNPLR